MKKKRWPKIVAATALVVAIGAGVVLFQGNGATSSAFAEEAARTGSLTTYYSFTGTVEVKKSQLITADAAVTVRDVYVVEGESVEKNDRLLRLSNGETIKAGVSGEVTELTVEKDDEVSAGETLVEIMNFDDMEIRIKVDEYDVAAIEIGKTAQVTINALNQDYESVITAFDKKATQSGDISYYTATIDTQGMENVLPGMKVDVKVINEQVENVTLISMNALQFDEYNQPYVVCRDSSGGTRNVPVEVGATDGIYVEIVGGLKSGETVLVSPSAQGSGDAGFAMGRM